MADTESGRRSSTALKWGITAVVLAGGYADLARGGETMAPILLVIGYVILVPIAIIS
jgi:energy-converting hydrogenase Eha subunit C